MTRTEYCQLVLAEKDRLNRFAAWFLRDAHEAADITQDALLRLWEHRNGVVAGAARTWLFRTIHRLCVDQARRLNGHASKLFDVVQMRPSLAEYSPADALRLVERRRDVAAALADLSPRDRTFVVLRELEGMSYDEIASVLECPLGSVKVGLHRARQRLREKLTDTVEQR